MIGKLVNMWRKINSMHHNIYPNYFQTKFLSGKKKKHEKNIEKK